MMSRYYFLLTKSWSLAVKGTLSVPFRKSLEPSHHLDTWCEIRQNGGWGDHNNELQEGKLRYDLKGVEDDSWRYTGLIRLKWEVFQPTGRGWASPNLLTPIPAWLARRNMGGMCRQKDEGRSRKLVDLRPSSPDLALIFLTPECVSYCSPGLFLPTVPNIHLYIPPFFHPISPCFIRNILWNSGCLNKITGIKTEMSFSYSSETGEFKIKGLTNFWGKNFSWKGECSGTSLWLLFISGSTPNCA